MLVGVVTAVTSFNIGVETFSSSLTPLEVFSSSESLDFPQRKEKAKLDIKIKNE